MDKLELNQDLTPIEYALLVVSWFFPWLGISILLLRKNSRASINLFDGVLVLVAFSYWLLLLTTSSSAYQGLLLASMACLPFFAFLLIAQMAHMSDWKVKDGVTMRLLPFALMLIFLEIGMSLHDLLGNTRDLEICHWKNQLIVWLAIISSVSMSVDPKHYMGKRSLLDGYISSAPTEEDLFFWLAPILLFVALTFPFMDSEIFNPLTVIFCL